MSMSKYASKEDWAEAMGYDCGRHGATEANCHFTVYSTPRLTAAWERGRDRAEAEKRLAAAPGSEAK
jgi:hypothetical protein